MNLYPLYSGSSGNCTLVEHKSTRLLIDAGVSGKAILSALDICRVDPGSIDAILVTHEHIDHIKSVGVFSRKFGIPVFANAKTWENMENKVGEIAQSNIRIFDTDTEFSVGDIGVLPFAIPHDTADPVAFSLLAGEKKLTIATDIGHVTANVFSALAQSSIVLLEANHDLDLLAQSSYPKSLQKRILSDHGHLSNESCGTLLAHLYAHGVRRAILGHLSRETNTEELAYQTVSACLSEAGIGSDYMLKTAHRDRVCGKFEV